MGPAHLRFIDCASVAQAFGEGDFGVTRPCLAIPSPIFACLMLPVKTDSSIIGCFLFSCRSTRVHSMLVSGQIAMMRCSECTYQLYAVFEAEEDDQI